MFVRSERTDMNSVIAFLFVLLATWSAVSAQTVIKRPQNTAQYRGRAVQMECGINQGEPFQVQWAECISTAPTCNPVTIDDQHVPGASNGRYDRYRAINQMSTTGKQYNLVISGVELEDGGQFRCSDVGIHDKLFSELIVVEEPSCTTNLTSSTAVAGDNIQVTCNITYQGRWAPVMRFRGPSGAALLHVVNDTIPGQASYSAAVYIESRVHQKNISMEAFFATPTGLEAEEAANTPNFPSPNTFHFDPIVVAGIAKRSSDTPGILAVAAVFGTLLLSGY